MKKTALLIAVAAVVATLAVACQKDNAKPEPQAVVQTAAYPTGNINYTVGKVSNTVTISNAEQWKTLLNSCLDGADSGHLVTIAHQGSSASPSKERLTYVTDSREAALAWVDSRFNEGYDVTLWYDKEEGKYYCVASKSMSTGSFVAPNGFTYQPLGTYILGDWTKCLDHVTVLNDSAGYVDLDAQTGILSMTWEQIYNFYKIVPATVTDTNYSHLHITSDTISFGYPFILPYEVHGDIISPNSFINGFFYGEDFLMFRTFEWSQDTMLVFFLSRSTVYPKIYTRN